MPRHVDHERRRRDILEATLRVLAERGPGGLTFRSVAAEMDGGSSTTIVTHYFASRQELLDALVEMVAEWPDELRDLESGAEDQRTRLRVFLRWMLPADEEALREETARLNLVGERDTQLRTRHIFDTWDVNVRRLMAQHLEGVVEADDLEAVLDVLRSVTNGITLSVVEHPDKWTPERQFAVLDRALAALDLLPEPIRSTS